MASDRLNAEQADDVLSGRRTVRRGAPEGVEHVVAVLHASRELEPPPPMAEGLRAEVYGVRPGAGSRAVLVPAGNEEVATSAVVRTARPRSARRALASMAAAAALLVGVVLAATLPEDKAGMADVGDGAPPTRAPSNEPSTGPSTSAPAGASIDEAMPMEAMPPGTDAEAPPTSVAAAPEASAPEPSTAPAAPAPGDETGDRRHDDDQVGYADGSGDGWDRDRYGNADDPVADEHTDDTAAPSTTSTTEPPSAATTSTTAPQADDGTTTTTTTPWDPDEWWWDIVRDFTGP
jgi:hypothetical protein